MASVFITGTDTNVGKTFCAVALLQQMNMKGYKTFGLKPVAFVCILNDKAQLVNEDALAIQKAASIKRDYQIVNPSHFKNPLPHILQLKKRVFLFPLAALLTQLHVQFNKKRISISLKVLGGGQYQLIITN